MNATRRPAMVAAAAAVAAVPCTLLSACSGPPSPAGDPTGGTAADAAGGMTLTTAGAMP